MYGVFLCRWFFYVFEFIIGIVFGDRLMLVIRYEYRGFFFLGLLWFFLIYFMFIVVDRLIV